MIRTKIKLSSKFIVIFGFLLIGAFLFYWFEYRPVKIRRYCYQATFGELRERMSSNMRGDKEWKPGKMWMPNPEAQYGNWGWWYPSLPGSLKGAEIEYTTCLLKNGMKVEIPILPHLD